MPDGHEPIAVKVLSRVAEVPAAQWDACAGAASPFVRHAFLDALEASGSAVRETGWLPQHLAIEGEDGRLVGAAPLYLKGHSYGEYVFDWSWANAYERAGGNYYPKLQSCVPFTPVTGPRLLIRPDVDRETITSALIAGMAELAYRHDVSSLHITFPLEAEWRRFGEAGLQQRIGLQYHWENAGYESFDDFLGALASRKRKAIRRERAKALESGLTIRTLVGDEVKAEHWDAFYRFYVSTSDRKWGSAYLTRAFFDHLGQAMPGAVVLVIAEEEGKPVAGALNLMGGGTLYGRNWGAVRRHKFLHFELCYYRAIDFAIAQGLGRVEAGAQGEHKIQRGYLPSETYSAHLIRDGGLREAVDQFLRQERAMIDHEKAALAELSPFRKPPVCTAGLEGREGA
ncbi:MAG: GNAT family N-acetyltransferase [Kiloniellales bacterium]|nr:GNAT family N-acetyltransferase [Kiloniellales bacterium]